jgi:hypothetical protein
LGAAVLASACAEENDTSQLKGQSGAITTGNSPAPAGSAGSAGSGELANVPPGMTAKQYFGTFVQPSLAKTCGGCHSNGPAPVWIAANDVEKSYALQFERGYVSKSSTILHKGSHSNGSAPALGGDQAQAYTTWIALELKERGDKVPDSVLQKVGDCLDAAKFKAIGFEKLVTTPRTADNNPGKETENTDECTGCNQMQCNSCHSADDATGFMMAIGNDIFPEDHTFQETKSVSPPYIQKYIGLDPNGNPIATKAIKAKSDATVQTGKAYSHPMFILSADMQKAIDAFVDDAISKFKAGTCGK